MRLALRSLVGLVLVALAVGSLSSPASARPGQVSPPWAVAASPHSVTLTWPAKSGVKRYEVLYATSYSGVKKASAKSKKTSGKQTRLTITGLKANQMYCFMVRGLSGSGVGNRSQRHCKPTMRAANVTSRAKVSVATFNVCGKACTGTRAFANRQKAVLDRIVDADAYVVAIQEGSGVIGRLETELAKRGYALASASSTEAVFYRPSKLSPVTTTIPATGCSGDPVVCTTPERQEPVAGEHWLGGSATSAWAQLRLKANGKAYTFVSAHLSNGKSSAKSRARDGETKNLIKKTNDAADGTPIVFAGDFNSTRNRPNDSPRLRLAKAGWFDAYDRSATYTHANFDSFNGYQRKAKRSIRYGDHVDRIFITNAMGSTRWEVVVRVKGTRYYGTMASDHNPVRTTLYVR